MNIKRVRNIAAILLLICIVLPMSRCAKKTIVKEPDGKTTIQEQSPVKYSYLIPVTEIKYKNLATYIYLLPFIWPFPLWFITSKCKKRWSSIILNVAELILLSISFYLIVIWTFYMGSPYWGGFIAVASITVLSILFLYQIVYELISRIKARKI